MSQNHTVPRNPAQAVKHCYHNGCVKIMPDGTCLAFMQPNYQWKNKTCFGFTDSVKELKRIFDESIINNSYNYWPNVQTLKHYEMLSDCISMHSDSNSFEMGN